MTRRNTVQFSKNVTLVDLLRARASDAGGQYAYTFLSGDTQYESKLTYDQLDRRAQSIAAILQQYCEPGARALLLFPPGLEYIAAFFGCMYAGIIAVPLHPPTLNRPQPHFVAVAANAQATVALTTLALLANVEQSLHTIPELQNLRWVATDNSDTNVGPYTPPIITGKTIAFLQYTSGSTVLPRGVMVSHANLQANLAAIHQAFAHSPDSRGVIWLPPYHDMGLIGGILQPIYGQFPVVLMSPVSFLQRPFHWLQAISRYRATTSGGPNFAYELCLRKVTPEQRSQLDLSSWKVAFNGAEPVRASTLERFATTFAECGFRLETFYPCYGLAESTLMVAGGDSRSAPIVRSFAATALGHHQVVTSVATQQATSQLVSCGTIIPKHQTVIVNPDTLTRCEDRQVGEIWVQGPSVAQGYWGLPEETAHVFQANHAGSSVDSFLRTGDLGFFYEGHLFITGRLKDLIIIRGRNYYPHDIELTAEQSHPGLRLGGGAAFSVVANYEEQLVIVHEVERQYRHNDTTEIVVAIRGAIAEQYGLRLHGVVLIKPGGLPKTSSGKPQRYVCRAAFLDNTLAYLARDVLDEPFTGDTASVGATLAVSRAALLRVSAADRRGFMTTYLRKCLGSLIKVSPEQIDDQRNLIAQGLDSLMAVELITQVERDLDIVLSVEHVLSGGNVAKVVEAMLSALDAPPASTTCAGIVSMQPLVQSSTEFPLSAGQRGLWFLQQLTPLSAAYNIGRAVHIHGTFDAEALRRAFQKLVDRHASLRTTFSATDGPPIQQTHARRKFAWQHEDASGWNEDTLNRRLAEDTYRAFNLEHDDLLRVSLFTRSAIDHVLLLVAHHIVVDFWSLALLLQELGTLYSAERKQEIAQLPPTKNYSAYVAWQTKMLTSPEVQQLQAYWHHQLTGDLPVLNLPTDQPRPPVQTFAGASYSFKLERTLTSTLRALCEQFQVTLYMLLLASFQVLLYRYTGQPDIIVGSPTAGRNRAQWTNVVGYFVNLIVLRANLSANPPFANFLQHVHQTVLEAFIHQQYPFALLAEQLQPVRDASRSPIFQALFSLQQVPAEIDRTLAALALGEPGITFRQGDLTLETMEVEQRTAQFDLALIAAEVDGTLRLSLQYNTDLFNATTIARMASHLQVLIAGICASPEQPVGWLPLLSHVEQQQVLARYTTMQRNQIDGCIHQMVEVQAQRIPTKAAVIYDGMALSFEMLDKRSNQWAHWLQRLGVGSGVRVGVCVERSIDMIIALLSILKSGAAYIPLDPDHPTDRLNYILADAQAAFLLTQTTLQSQFAQCSSQVIGIETITTSAKDESVADVHTEVWPDSLAYLIYTSGSTGKPKGVQIPHCAVVNFLQSVQQRPGFTEQDTLAAVTTLAFDIAGLEIWLPLVSGGCIALINSAITADGIRLAEALTNSGTTIMQATPATWRLLTETGWKGNKQLRVLCGGEVFPPTLAVWLNDKVAEVWNMYGPTETTIWSMIYKVEAGQRPIPLGQPITNTQIYILDLYLQPVPIGVVGELYIGGDGLAWGYHQHPALTAEKFLPNPHSLQLGARLYRTGDLARYMSNESIQYVGRIDDQVKIRGFRIELGEVEAHLGRCLGIQECAVLVQENTLREQRLVAYIVVDETVSPTAQELCTFLKQSLPDYMIPSLFVPVQALPRTPNNKVDRGALSAPANLLQSATSPVLPRTSIEEAIAAIWSEVIDIKPIGIYDNFFELGGHSLLATQVMFRIREQFRVDIPLHMLFDAPTVASLAIVVTDSQEQSSDDLDSILQKIESLSEDDVDEALSHEI